MSSHGSSLSPLPRLAEVPKNLALMALCVVLAVWPFVAAAVVLRGLFELLF